MEEFILINMNYTFGFEKPKAKTEKKVCFSIREKLGLPINGAIRNSLESRLPMTSTEKKIDEFLTSRRFDFQYKYDYENKTYNFAVFNYDREVVVLIEVTENSGIRVTSRNNIKFITADSSDFEKIYSEICEVFGVDYEKWVQEVINSLPEEFPYYHYDEKTLRGDYKNLCNARRHENGSATRTADTIIHHFHKSIYHSRAGNKISPYEAWQYPELKEKCVRNRFIYAKSLSPLAVVSGFNINKIAPKVSMFSAGTARYLIWEYLNEFDTIFDPFSGFSGRMLGACSLGKRYIGQDINEEHVTESNEIIDYFKLNAEVTQKDVFDSYGEYDCLFTCSPYNLKETWGNEDQADLSADEWIDVCLEHFKCKKYLFVVDHTKRPTVDALRNKSHFSHSYEKVVLIEK